MKKVHLLFLLLFLPGLTLAADENVPPPAKIRVSKIIEKEAFKRTKALGILVFDKLSHVSTEVAGLVEETSFSQGDRVTRGQRLVRINTNLLDKDIRIGELRIKQVDIRIRKAEKDLRRYEELYRDKVTSENAYDNLKFSYLDLLEEKEVLKESLEKNRLLKSKSIIKVPFDGLVLQKHVDVGDWLVQGKAICQIGSIHDLYAKIPIAENLLKYSKSGAPIDVTLNAFGETLKGTIDGVIPIADQKTKNVFLKVRLPELKVIIENMSVTAYVPISDKRMMNMVPRDALVNFRGKDFIFTVQDNKAVPIPINIVTYAGKHAGIVGAAVSTGMPVVVEGNERLRAGQMVQIAGED
ncbi:MAG: efflux RND transporter periplasmic adaptor subunit [Thermodesulfobacteriota bacterium]|nr:efflux RND transporter periplasmic adaptor subunit [Thermodesulfobacteriota bacterium]